MADQNVSDLSFEKQLQQGPFAQYQPPSWTQTEQQQQHPQPNGWERAAGKIGVVGQAVNMGSQFLKGLGMGRIRAFATQEAEKQQRLNAFLTILNSRASESGITEEKQAKYKMLANSAIAQGYLTGTQGGPKASGGASGGKSGGGDSEKHGMFGKLKGVVDNMAEMMAGGTKGKGLKEVAYGDLLKAMADIDKMPGREQETQKAVQNINTQITAARESDPLATNMEILSSGALQQPLSVLRHYNPEEAQALERRMQMGNESPDQKIYKENLREFLNEQKNLATPETPTTGQPQDQTTNRPPESRNQPPAGPGADILKDYYQSKGGKVENPGFYNSVPDSSAAPPQQSAAATSPKKEKQYKYYSHMNDASFYNKVAMHFIPGATISQPESLTVPGVDREVTGVLITGAADRSGFYSIDTGQRLPFAVKSRALKSLVTKRMQIGSHYVWGYWDPNNPSVPMRPVPGPPGPDGNPTYVKDDKEINWMAVMAAAGMHSQQMEERYTNEQNRINEKYEHQIQMVQRDLETHTRTDDKKARQDILDFEASRDRDLGRLNASYDRRQRIMRSAYPPMMAGMFGGGEQEAPPAPDNSNGVSADEMFPNK